MKFQKPSLSRSTTRYSAVDIPSSGFVWSFHQATPVLCFERDRKNGCVHSVVSEGWALAHCYSGVEIVLPQVCSIRSVLAKKPRLRCRTV
jgi:hypothetical protein